MNAPFWCGGESGAIRSFLTHPPTILIIRRHHIRLSQQPSSACYRSSHVQSYYSYSSRSSHLTPPCLRYNRFGPQDTFHCLARSGENRPALLLLHPCPHGLPLSTTWSRHLFTISQSPTHTPSIIQPPTAHLQPAGCTGCAAHLPLSPYPRPTTNRQHPGMPHVPALLSHLLFHPPPL